MPSNSAESGDLVGQDFWDANWSGSKRRHFRPANYYHRDQDHFLRRVLPVGGRFLELGCAGSIWLGHFASAAEVWGLDYSATGIEHLRAEMRSSGVRLVVGDLFDPRNGVPRGYFDLVFSDGLLEHFSDARSTVEAFASYVKPGGILVTSVPNMHGLIGRLHRLVFREFYAAHIRYVPAQLDQVHTQARLEPVARARYWGHVSLGVLNYRRLFRRIPSRIAELMFLGILVTQQIAAWAAHIFRVPDNALVSPHLRGAYRKPQSEAATAAGRS
jgi:SAM-dependent methyltransferase